MTKRPHRIALAFGVALAAAGFALAQGEAEEGGGAFPIPEWAKKCKEHDALAKFAGEWATTSKFEGQEEHGSASSKLAFGGFYLESDVSGTAMGTPFAGRWTLGYDTLEKKYVSFWIDSFSPVPSFTYGEEKDGALVFEGMEADWQSDTKTRSRMKLAWNGPEEYVLRFYALGPDGAETPRGEFVYTRKKKG